MEENGIVIRLYDLGPVYPVPMTKLLMLDLKAVEFIMDVYKVQDRQDVLERLILYHNALQSDEAVKMDQQGSGHDG